MPSPTQPTNPIPIPDDQGLGYGKALAAAFAGTICLGVTAVANQYLPQPLPVDAVSLVQAIATIVAVWAVKHEFGSAVTGKSSP